jgi:hypothetical protein
MFHGNDCTLFYFETHFSRFLKRPISAKFVTQNITVVYTRRGCSIACKLYKNATGNKQQRYSSKILDLVERKCPVNRYTYAGENGVTICLVQKCDSFSMFCYFDIICLLPVVWGRVSPPPPKYELSGLAGRFMIIWIGRAIKDFK